MGNYYSGPNTYCTISIVLDIYVINADMFKDIYNGNIFKNWPSAIAALIYRNLQQNMKYTFHLFILIQPIPAADIKKAQEHIDSFLEIYEREFGLSAMTYKMHSLGHMLEDVEFHRCHLEYLSSYPYENFHGKWRVFLRSGRLPLEQIRFVN